MYGAEIFEQGWPLTTAITDDAGQTTGYRVTADYQTPPGAKLHSNLCALTGTALLLWVFWPGGSLWQQALFAALAQGVIHWVVKVMTTRETVIVITAQTITINDESWDMAAAHFYSMLLHERSEREEREEQLWQSRQADRSPRQYPQRHYRESYHIALHIMDQKIPIADVYGERRAVMLLDRLKGVDQMMRRTAEIETFRRAAR